MCTREQLAADIAEHTELYLDLMRSGALSLEAAHTELCNLEGTEMTLMQIAGFATAVAIYQCGES